MSGCVLGTIPESLGQPRRWVLPSSFHFTGKKTGRFLKARMFYPTQSLVQDLPLKRLPRADQECIYIRRRTLRRPPQCRPALHTRRLSSHLPEPAPNDLKRVLRTEFTDLPFPRQGDPAAKNQATGNEVCISLIPCSESQDSLPLS